MKQPRVKLRFKHPDGRELVMKGNYSAEEIAEIIKFWLDRGWKTNFKTWGTRKQK